MFKKLAIGALVITTTVVCGGSGGVSAAACASPFLPVYVETSGYDGIEQVYPEQPVQPPERSTNLVNPGDWAFDMDGDGAPDRIVSSNPDDPDQGDDNTIRRGDGDVVVLDEGRGVGVLHGVGDLDGDGRDEVMVATYSLSDYDDHAYLLPGSTAPGSYALADVAIRIPSTPSADIGNVNGRDGDDVVFTVEGPGSRIVEGADAMAPGPGGVLDAVPAGDDLPGYLAGVWREDDRTRSVLQSQADDIVIWELGSMSTYRGLPGYTRWSSVEVFASGGAHFLAADYSDRYDPDTTTYWNIDDPCAPLPRAAGEAEGTDPTPAPAPADPIESEPTFTG